MAKTTTHEREWIPCGKTWREFTNTTPSMSLVGYMIRVDGEDMLVGDINQAGGVCECCSYIGNDTIVEAYSPCIDRGRGGSAAGRHAVKPDEKAAAALKEMIDAALLRAMCEIAPAPVIGMMAAKGKDSAWACRLVFLVEMGKVAEVRGDAIMESRQFAAEGKGATIAEAIQAAVEMYKHDPTGERFTRSPS